MNRRTFDWDEARRLRQTGMTLAAVAERMGVSPSAVWLATDPEANARQRAYQTEWKKQHGSHCADCGIPISWSPRQHKRPTRCKPCSIKRQAITVRDATLQCYDCREWKPDDQFFFDAGGYKARRGRGTTCKICMVVRRKKARDRNRVQCAGGCGKLVLSPKDTGGGLGMCVACTNRTRKQRQAQL